MQILFIFIILLVLFVGWYFFFVRTKESPDRSNPSTPTSMMIEDTLTPNDYIYKVNGTKTYKESSNEFYDDMNNCVNECKDTEQCKAVRWYSTGTFGNTGKKCKFMWANEFENPDWIQTMDNKQYYKISLSTKNTTGRHFVKDELPERRTDDDGVTYLRFNWMS